MVAIPGKEKTINSENPENVWYDPGEDSIFMSLAFLFMFKNNQKKYMLHVKAHWFLHQFLFAFILHVVYQLWFKNP